LDDELINITLETPLNSFFIYFNENKNEINADEYKNNKFIEIRKKMITNWKKLSDEEKAPYIKKQNEEIKRYEIIRKYLLLEKVYLDNKKEVGYDLFLNDEIINCRNQNISINRVKNIAKTKWDLNFENIRQKYTEIKKNLLNYIQNLNKVSEITGFDIFNSEKRNICKTKWLSIIKKEWKNLEEEIRLKYNSQAIIENIKNEYALNSKEIINNNINKKNRINPFDLLKKILY